MTKGRLLLAWLYARRLVMGYVLVVYAAFFVVYALYGYGWGVAGYAALLGVAAGLAFAAWDLAHFAHTHRTLARMAGRFPTSPLPPAANLIAQDYGHIITALEAQRAQLERDGESASLDAGEYYTLWAHQVKTPLAAMQLIIQSGDGQIGREAASSLGQELFRTGQYVDMVLQYQRLASLQNDLVLNSHSLEALAKKAARGCAPLFIYKGLALDMDGLAGTVVTDEKWFCFVLEQLFTNAVKYTQTGAVRLYMAGPETMVVEDTGIGIAPEDLPRVFERGFTGAAGRTERSSTGIGLYLCRRILARLGFSITIESAPGRGTRVLLHLRQEALDNE